MERTSTKQPFLIGLTGGSGSGKTSFVKELKQQFSDSEVCFLSQDDYYRPRDEQKMDDQGVRNFDLPRSIDKKAFRKDIRQLIEGTTVTRQEYVFNNELAEAKTLTFKPAPIILVEGIFVFHFKKISKLFDLRVFIHAKENLKVIRRIKRDQVERNYPIDDVLYRYENHVLPTYERYILPYMHDADLVINNNDDFDMGLAVLSGFMRNYLTAAQPGD